MDCLEQTLFSRHVICESSFDMSKELAPVIEELKKWRIKNKLSQSQATRVLNTAGLPISLDSLQNWEIGRNNPSPLAAVALLDFLNRNPEVKLPVTQRNKRKWTKLRTSSPHFLTGNAKPLILLSFEKALAFGRKDFLPVKLKLAQDSIPGNGSARVRVGFSNCWVYPILSLVFTYEGLQQSTQALQRNHAAGAVAPRIISLLPPPHMSILPKTRILSPSLKLAGRTAGTRNNAGKRKNTTLLP
jgi:DNA-binding transcriptional regulator YiaG